MQRLIVGTYLLDKGPDGKYLFKRLPLTEVDPPEPNVAATTLDESHGELLEAVGLGLNEV